MAAWKDQVEFVFTHSIGLFNLMGAHMVEIERIDDPVLDADGGYIGPCYRVTVGSLFSSRSWYAPRTAVPEYGLEQAVQFAAEVAAALADSKHAARRLDVVVQKFDFVEEARRAH